MLKKSTISRLYHLFSFVNAHRRHASKWSLAGFLQIAFAAAVMAQTPVVTTYTTVGSGPGVPANVFTVPAGVTKVKVQVWGGGGGGGGADSNTGQNRAGGGGSGGSYTENTSFTVTPGATINITVGAGGVGGTGGNNAPTSGTGQTGGTSSFSTLSAVGGAGGAPGVNNSQTGAGGATTTGVTKDGGAGGEAPPGGASVDATGSGGGGASGGPSANGPAGSGAVNGDGSVSGGGSGAHGYSGNSGPFGIAANTAAIGLSATEVGGGGAGGWDNFGNDDATHGTKVGAAGGDGFHGQVIVTYTIPDAPTGLDLASVDDSGSSNSDNITNVTTNLSISGSSNPNTTIQLQDNGVNIGSTVVSDGAGAWGPIDINLTAGSTHAITAIPTLGGNTGPASSALNITVDTSAPAIPSVPDLTAGTDTGSSSTDDNTNDNTPDFSGTAEAGSTVTILSDGVSAGTGTATGGNYSITTSTIADGSHNITATATDAAGNASTASAALAVTIDTTPPAAPSQPDLTAGTDSGSSSTDNITNDNTPDFAGTATAGATVEIVSSVSGVVGSGTATGGNYSITVSTLTDGPHNITARITDVAGNTGISTPLAVTIDTSAPAIPSVPDMTAGTDTGSSSTDNITSDNTPDFAGTAEAGSTVTILSDASSVGTGTATGGNYTITVSTIADGAHSITATATDAAGNTSSASSGLSVTVDTQAPAFSAVSVSVSPVSSIAKIGDVVTVTLESSTAETTLTGGTITVNSITGTLTNAGGGTYTVAYTVASGNNDWSTGALPLSIGVKDVAGNTKTVVNSDFTDSNTLAGDAHAPAAPSTPDLVAGDDSGTSNTDNITNVSNSLHISGTSDPSVTINVFRGGSTMIGTTTASAGGAWSITTSSALADAVYSITAVAVDAAGNPSAASSALSLTIDTSAPSAPSTPDLTSGTDSGTSNSDNITNNLSPSFTGTAETGAIVKIFSSVDAGTRGSATISVGTTYTVATTLATQGNGQTHSITATATDVAGNTSTASSGLTITLDATAPTISTAAFFPDNSNNGWKHNYLCNGSTTTATSNTEFFHLGLSEALAVADGTIIPVMGAAGFTVSVGAAKIDVSCDSKGAAVYHSGTNTIHLKSASDNDFSSATTISFTPGGTIIKDIAGNEMGTVTSLVAGDLTPPSLATGLVFFPNGSGNETIVFTVDEGLNASVGSSPTGFIPSTGAGTLLSASYNSTTNVVTLTSNGNGVWTDAMTLQYDPAIGNVLDPANNEMVAFAAEPILLRNVHIFSNNGTNTAFATTGNTVSITFTASLPLASTPVATIGGLTATVTGTHPNYTASIVTTAAVPETAIAFTITADETNRSTDVTATTDGSSVTFDKTAPATPTVPDLAAADDSGSSNTDNLTNHTTALTFTGTAEANATVQLFNGVSSLGTTTASAGGAWTIDLGLGAGSYSINAKAIDAAGNTSSSSGNLSLTIDTTFPNVVVSNGITLPDANPNNTGTVHFTVTFDEPVIASTVDAADFVLNGTASGGTASITGVSSSSSTVYTVTASNLNLAGTLGLTLSDNNTITDLAANPLGGPTTGDGTYSSATTYDIIFPEPANHVTSFAVVPASVTTTGLQLSWINSTGFPTPGGYLITVERSGATATVPVDGTPVSNQTDLINNTTGYLNISAVAQLADFSGLLLSGETYTFRIYPYSNSGTNIDYKVGGTVPQVVKALTTANNVTIGALSQSVPNEIPTVGSPNVNFQFFVWDIGSGHGDNAPTRVSQIIIRQGSGNDAAIADWTNIIQSVSLSENTTLGGEVTGVPARVVTGGSITPNSITFSSLLTDAFGRISDGQFKYYDLKITLKNTFTGTLPEIIDNLHLSLQLSSADITFAANSSQLAAANTISGYTPTVAVVATELDFSTSPNASQLVSANVTSTSAAPDGSLTPVVRARDIHGNTDLNFNATINLANAGTLGMTPTSVAMTGGVATFPSTFQYQAAGDGTLTASTTQQAANTLIPAPGASTAVTVTYSSLTTLASAFTAPNVSSLGTTFASFHPYHFTVTDDGGAGGDGSPTLISSIKITKKASTSPIPDWRDILNVVTNGDPNNAGALLYDGSTGSWANATVTVNQNDITISNMLSTASAADLGYIADGTARTYQLYIWFRSTLNGGLAPLVDHMNFDFEVIPGNITIDPNGSQLLGAQTAINSGLIDVDVAATKLVFTTEPSIDVLVNQNLAATPIVEARDVNGNLDLDYAPSSGVSITTPAPAIPLSNAPTAFVAGVLTFPSNFQYTTIGNGTAGNGTLTVNSSGLNSSGTAPSSATSSPATTVRVGNASTITAGALTEPASISSIIDDGGSSTNPSSGGIDVFDFTINDDPGGTPITENDGNPTRIQTITITQGAGNNIINWSDAVLYAQLSDGTGNSGFGNVNATSIVFGNSGLPNTLSTDPGFIADNGSKTYTLRIWLKKNLGGTLPVTIDGLRFVFEVVSANVVTNPNGTSILNGQNQNSGTANQVSVIATQLDVTTPATAVNVSINANFTASTAPVLQARDANGNRDLGFTGPTSAITAFSNASGATMVSGPVIGTTQFTNGLLNFSSALPNFKFTSGNNNDDVTLTIKAGTGTTCGTNAICNTVINPALTLKTNTITAGAGPEPLTLSSIVSTPLQVFDFKVNDDDNLAAGTDLLPTLISQIVITPLAGGNDIADWSELIASAILSDGTNQVTTNVIGTNAITFSSLGTSSGQIGYVTDNASKTYTLKITLRSTLGGTLATNVDNLNLAFEVLATNITVGPATTTSSTFSNSENENSGAANNAIQVIATKLKWTTEPASSLLVNKDISLQLPKPVIEALDANNNRDLNYTTSLNITNGGSLPMSAGAQSNVTTFSLIADGSAPLNGGIYTFPNDFQFNTIGDGQMTALPSVNGTVNNASTEKTSTAVTVRVGISGTITASGALAEPATISSLADDGGVTLPSTPSSGGTNVFDFTVNDDPGLTPADPENDGNPLLISSITVTQGTGNTVTDWSDAIAFAQLSDGTGNSGFGAINASSIVFSNMIAVIPAPTDPGYIADNGSKTYTLKIWLKRTMTPALASTIDGLRFNFEVITTSNPLTSGIVTDPNGTAILIGENQNSGSSKNQVAVDATQLTFTNPAAATSTSLNTSFIPSGTPVTVQAQDANHNLDKDFTGKITYLVPELHATDQTQNGPTLGTSAFTGGVYTFANNFQFITGSNGDDVALTIKADNTGGNSGVNCTAGTGDAICGTSPTITLQTSFESSIVLDPTFTPSVIPTPPAIPYVDYQTTDIQNTGTSYELVRALLVDGSRDATFTYVHGTQSATLDTNTDSGDLQANGDTDGAATNLTSITLRISSPSALRRIAIYSNGVEIAEQDVAGLNLTPANDPTHDFVFTGAPLLVAADDQITELSVRVSFMNSASKLTDHDDLKVDLVAATLTVGTGSQFFNGRPADSGTGIPGNTGPFIGGQTHGAGAQSFGTIEILATKLDFTSQPGSFAGINEPVVAGVVQARDPFNLVDLDFNFTGTIATSGSGPSVPAAATSFTSSAFVNGVLNLAGMTYTSPGDGTMIIAANGISTTTNNTVTTPAGALPNIATSCSHVDVINVYTTLATGGVVSSPNLAGGAVNKVVFGVTFNAPYRIGAHPFLNKFTISFSNTITGVFKNFRVFESTDNTFGGDVDVTNVAIGGKVTAASKSLVIDFTQTGGVPRNLTSGGASQITYFLMVDVDPTANSATPSIQPFVEDLGFSDPTTNSNIVTTIGSTYSLDATNAVGKTKTPAAYTFAAIFPPTLVSSNPANGQLNVDPNKATIDLVFSVPVWTMDGVIALYDKSTNALVQTLTAVNGQYAGGNTANLVGTAANPMKFTLPTLLPNHLYYITIAPAKFNGAAATDNVGIMDENANLFPGISYSGALYFKTANPNPPVLLSTAPAPAPSITNVSTRGAVINATFDQQGTAYFMVVAQGSTAPTKAQIKDPVGNPYPAGPQAGTYVTNGNFAINQTNTISQFGLITLKDTDPDLPANTTFDVWMYAENNALPTPFETAAPYGGAADNYAVGGTHPTLSFTTPASPSTSVSVNNPIMSICTNSFQVLNAPIIISEGNNSNFTSSGVQTFNLLLPSGFQFDDSRDSHGKPVYGQVALLGSDFVANSGSLNFINNSILQVTYSNNNTSTSSDNIIIYGLRVKATAAANGNVVRLGGNALATGTTSQILADLTPMANLNATDANPIDFNNSYSSNTYPGKPVPVTFIPDNYDDPNIATPLVVQLDPIQSANDFGPSSFVGTGVNVDNAQLSLTAVTLGSPFNVTITHTDNNGCVSTNPVQYTVYDHTKAIGGLLTSYGIVNSNFPAQATVNTDVKSVLFNNIVANYMLTMTADIPVTATPVNPANPQPTDQIMFGADWKALVQTLPVPFGAPHDPGNNPIFGQLYSDYQFDVSKILNANSLSGGAIREPYDNFKKTTPVQGNFYYAGGSLGLVEFTANYQSIANSILQFPLKQNVEFFLPAIPIVELGQGNRSSLDTSDPLNPVGSSNVNPVGTGNANKGTQIFCEQGGTIDITGYPNAVTGISTGSFKLIDAASGTVLLPTIAHPNPTLLVEGFVDNGNGTASIDPAKFANGYKDIKILYTYQQNIAPANTVSSGYQFLRISPNPVADFNVGLLCENTEIPFTDASTVNSVPGVTINKWTWDFADANSNLNTSPLQNPTHNYKLAGSYPNVQLNITTNDGCSSVVPKKVNLNVGGKPDVNFTFTGISTADAIVFNSASSVSNNDEFAALDWYFDDGHENHTTYTNQPHNPTGNFVNTYTDPRLYNVKLVVTSKIGCSDSIRKQVVILPKEIPGATAAYYEDFESDDGDWQTLPKGPAASPESSWAHGVPAKSVIKRDPKINGNTGNAWATSLTGTYQPLERSYLYSPLFDLSDLDRPMVSFNSIVQLPKTAAGVVLQYSTDDKNVADPTKTWTVLGNVGSGAAWYSGQNIVSHPGEQTTLDVGWDNSTITNWVESKHQLNVVKGSTGVVFRFAFATSETTVPAASEGFAIDNFRVGNRTRIVLLENFTNLGNDAKNAANKIIEAVENDSVSVFVQENGASVVKLDYHVGFPFQDPLNLDNQQDPGARALYYNISKTPRLEMDGYIPDPDGLFSQWGKNVYNTTSLKLADAEIKITAKPASMSTDGSVGITVEVTALRDLGPKTILQVAVVEKSISMSSFTNNMQNLVKTGINRYEYVVKKLLPDASGTRFSVGLPNGQTRTFPETGEYAFARTLPIYSSNDLAVVAFLQNEDTKEVFQTEIIDLPDPSILTAVESNPDAHFNVYPSPADHQMMIELPEVAEEQTRTQLFDQLGNAVHESNFEKGEKQKVIGTSHLAAGVYIIQVQTQKGVLRRKVMVMHHN